MRDEVAKIVMAGKSLEEIQKEFKVHWQASCGSSIISSSRKDAKED